MLLKKMFASSIFLFLLISIVFYSAVATETKNLETYIGDNSYQNNLLHHSLISIVGNDEFTSKNGVTGGSGTSEDPYIISNWRIHSIVRTGISITGTTSYFVIENCYISGTSINTDGGIIFNNVTNGRIINCICCNFKKSFGILIISSSNNTIEKCRCEKNSFGLSINGCPQGYKSSSNDNRIKDCIFSDCSDGIYFCCLPSSSNNVIESCICRNNKRGIVLDHCIQYTTIVGCSISNNKEVGLEIISASDNNHISNNIFWDNKNHAYDNCKNIWDNGPIFGGNYWSGNYSSIAYTVPGEGDNKDNYPLDKPTESKPLIALFNYKPRIPITHSQTYFDASLSYEPDDNILLYEWDFGDETVGTGCRVNHTYESDEEYNVTLTITNETTNDTIIRKINVINLCNDIIHVSNNSSIQEAINYAKPGNTIYVDNGTYHENIIIDKPYLNLIGSGSSDTIIDGCQIGDVIYITAPFVNISGFTITDSSEGKAGIQIGIPDYSLDSMNCCIEKNNISGNSIGVNMSETEQNNIVGNTITNNDLFGIYVIRSYYNFFDRNYLSFNNVGIWLEYGSNWNEIKNNTILSNAVGIVLNWSHYNKIIRNDVSSNKIGLKLNYVISPKINYNNIYDNQKYGLVFTDTIINLNAQYNWWGSRCGPSWFLSAFGDKVIETKKTGLPKLTGRIMHLVACYPWEKEML